MSYRNPPTGILRIYNANKNPIVLLVETKKPDVAVIDYDDLFEDIFVKEQAKKKVTSFLMSE